MRRLSCCTLIFNSFIDCVKHGTYNAYCKLQVTGDNRTTAEALAEELELPKDRILAGVLPRDKVAKVRLLHRYH